MAGGESFPPFPNGPQTVQRDARDTNPASDPPDLKTQPPSPLQSINGTHPSCLLIFPLKQPPQSSVIHPFQENAPLSTRSHTHTHPPAHVQSLASL